jgi:thiol-disulfide isomerase/thioredoxin
MPDRIGRRAILGGLATPFMAMPALARTPFHLSKDPQPLLSPPILDEAGTTRKLDAFFGRVVLLNIWATWCPPCRDEMPALDRLQKTLGGDRFTVLPLNIDEGGITRGREFHNEVGIRHLPLFWAEPLRVQLAFAFIGLPTTLLVNNRGHEIGRLLGPFKWDSRGAVDQLRDVIGQR